MTYPRHVTYQKHVWCMVALAWCCFLVACSADVPQAAQENNVRETVAVEDTGSMAVPEDEAESVETDSGSATEAPATEAPATEAPANGESKKADRGAPAVLEDKPLVTRKDGDPVSTEMNDLDTPDQPPAMAPTPEVGDALGSGEEKKEATRNRDSAPGARGSDGARSESTDRHDEPPHTARSIADFFPLDANCRWVYRVRVERSGKEAQEATATKSVKGKKKIGDREYVRVVTEFAQPVPDQHYRVDSGGVYAAVQGADKELLILPAKPKNGTRWSGEAQPSISKFTGSVNVGETYRVDDQVYQDCTKVTLSMNLVVGSLFGRREIPVRFVRWFVPGVGMVAEVREVGPSEKPDERWVSELTRTDP